MSDSETDACCQEESCCQEKADGGPQGGCCGGAKPPQLTPMTKEQLINLPSAALISRYRRGIENFDRRVFELNERELDTAFLPEAGVGLWPVRVLVGHCADADLAAIHRMRRAVAEENPLLADWDENAFVDQNLYGNDHAGYADSVEGDRARVMQSLGGHMAVIHTLRQWAGQWLLTLTEAQLDRLAMHPVKGPMTVRQIVASYTFHIEHHAQFLTKKLDKLVGPAENVSSGANARSEKTGGAKSGGCGCNCG